MNRLLVTLGVLMVVLAGCSSGVVQPTGEATDGPGSAADGAGSGAAPTAGSTGTIDFYISDQPNAIDEFDHLTVNITKVGFHRAGGDDGDEADDGDTGTAFPNGSVSVEGDLQYDNASFPPNGSVALDGNLTAAGDFDLNGTVPNGTMNASGTVDADGNASLSGEVTYNATEFPDHPNGTVELEGTVSPEGVVELNGTVTLFGEDSTSGNVSLAGTVTPEADDSDGGDDGEPADGGEAGWIERDVGAEVDLTEVLNDDAQLISTMDLPSGKYTAVFVYVGDINASVGDSQVDVKLPSDRLMLNKNFDLGGGETVEFVYDIGVHKAGGSGKYVLRPVVSESGTDVPINAVETAPGPGIGTASSETGDDANGPPDRDGKPAGPPGQAAKAQQTDGDEPDGDDAGSLELSIDGEAVAGENATVVVESNGSPVEGASVSVDGEDADTTDANGTVTVEIPADEKRVKIRATTDDAEGTLVLTFDVGGGPPEPKPGKA